MCLWTSHCQKLFHVLQMHLPSTTHLLLCHSWLSCRAQQFIHWYPSVFSLDPQRHNSAIPNHAPNFGNLWLKLRSSVTYRHANVRWHCTFWEEKSTTKPLFNSKGIGCILQAHCYSKNCNIPRFRCDAFPSTYFTSLCKATFGEYYIYPRIVLNYRKVSVNLKCLLGWNFVIRLFLLKMLTMHLKCRFSCASLPLPKAKYMWICSFLQWQKW